MSSTYVTTHSPTLTLLHLRHSSFPNTSIASPMSQLMSRAHCPTFLSLHLHHSSFSNSSVASPMSQLILQLFCLFTYVTAHSPHFFCFSYITTHPPTLPSLYLRHSSFSNPSFASPTSQALHLIHLVSHPYTISH